MREVAVGDKIFVPELGKELTVREVQRQDEDLRFMYANSKKDAEIGKVVAKVPYTNCGNKWFDGFTEDELIWDEEKERFESRAGALET